MNNPLLGVGCVCWDLRLSLMSIENRCTFKKSNLSVNIHHAATHALVLKRCLHILSSFTAFCCCCCCCFCCCCYCYWETCLIFFSISFSDDIDEQEQLETFQCLHVMSLSLNFKIRNFCHNLNDFPISDFRNLSFLILPPLKVSKYVVYHTLIARF